MDKKLEGHVGGSSNALRTHRDDPFLKQVQKIIIIKISKTEWNAAAAAAACVFSPTYKWMAAAN